MAKTAAYWQKGDSLDYTNKTDQTIPAGTVLVFGKRMGVARDPGRGDWFHPCNRSV